MKLDDEIVRSMSSVLGRSIVSEEGIVSSFNDFTHSDINDVLFLKKNNSVYAVSYIRFKLRGNVPLRLVLSYYSMVVQEGKFVKDWMVLEGL